jgi:hypothetical protein
MGIVWFRRIPYKLRNLAESGGRCVVIRHLRLLIQIKMRLRPEKWASQVHDEERVLSLTKAREGNAAS